MTSRKKRCDCHCYNVMTPLLSLMLMKQDYTVVCYQTRFTVYIETCSGGKKRMERITPHSVCANTTGNVSVPHLAI